MSRTIGKIAVCAAAMLLAHTASLAQMPGMNPGQGPQPGMNGQMMQPGMQPGMNPMGMPMMMQMQQQGHAPLMATAAGYLYVLRGNTLFQYTLKDLKLAAQAQLPMDRPRLTGPMPGQPGPGMLPPNGGGAPTAPDAGEPKPPATTGNQSPALQDGGELVQVPQGPQGMQGMPGMQGPMPGQDPIQQMMQMQRMQGMQGMPMQMMMGGPPPLNLVATAEQVVVLRGNTLFAFSAKGLEPIGRADMPNDQPLPMRGPGGATRPTRPRANP